MKATIGLGNGIDMVKTVVDVVGKIAEWADKPIQLPDVDACAEQVYENLKKQRE